MFFRQLKNEKILIVVDQFEDILDSPEPFDDFIRDLCSIYALYRYSKEYQDVRFLFVLRSDARDDLERKIFRKVQSTGFPTVILGLLSRDGAREALKTGFESAGVDVKPELIEEILDDLINLSQLSEIYPPYLQMVGEELCKDLSYYKLGRAKGIVANYLLRKLDEFKDDKDKAIKILKSLVSYKGRKAQKSASEIEDETGIKKNELSELLKQLVDKRMIRKINGNYEMEIMR